MTEQKLATEEWELIEMLRNYRRGYPNTKFLRREITIKVAELLKPSYREEIE